MATIFYITSVLVMPVVEVARSVRAGRWSAEHWRLIVRHVAIGGVMAVTIFGTIFYFLPDRMPSMSVVSKPIILAINVTIVLVLFAWSRPSNRRPGTVRTSPGLRAAGLHRRSRSAAVVVPRAGVVSVHAADRVTPL